MHDKFLKMLAVAFDNIFDMPGALHRNCENASESSFEVAFRAPVISRCASSETVVTGFAYSVPSTSIRRLL